MTHLYMYIFRRILCLVSDEWGTIGPYKTDLSLSDYVAGSTKFNKFYLEAL